MENEWTEKRSLNGYRHIEELTAKENGPVLVRSEKNQQFWVKKQYPIALRESLETLKQIRHINLPKIEEVFVEEKQLFLYEEYIHGTTLSDRIRSSEQMDTRQILELARDILAGLSELHKYGVIHRDIKPSNIMITNDETIKLIDFDAVRIISGEKDTDTVQLGTVGFAAPEQFGFAETDQRSDLYSLGVVMNVCATLDYPKNKLTEEPLLKEIISKAVRIDPSDRYQTAEAMRAAVITSLKLLDSVEARANEQLASTQNKTDFELPKPVSAPPKKQESERFDAQVFSTNKKKKQNFFSQYVPGFRTGQWWKKVLAVAFYAVSINQIVYIFSSSAETYEKILDLTDFFMIFIIPMMMYTNFLDFHRDLPLLSSDSQTKRVIGYVVLAVCWFLLLLLYFAFRPVI
ncbi:serine/threonine protein kinase [Enterococcus sp. LJL51]|uniref:serine/threonine protein kinase n=1 Tax=Enterococcus sp. LJL51 TaxID=3416656 RepID=UPI003CF38215